MRLSPRNPMSKALVSVLVFEAVCFALAVPGMIQVSGMAAGLAIGLGVGGVLLAVVAALTLRRPVGYPLAWLTQVAIVVGGFATPMLFVVGGILALVWIISFVLGKRIETADQAA